MSESLLDALGNPDAVADVFGSSEHKEIKGRVQFYQTLEGVWIVAEFCGLPVSYMYENGIYGFHIHEGWLCRGNEEDAFAGAEAHYNPRNNEHPYHAGDLPPLFGNNGYAFMVFLTNRFCVDEIIGKVVIVHSNADDFRSQPAGNAGKKIACGKICKMC